MKNIFVISIIISLLPVISKSQEIIDKVSKSFAGVESIEVKGFFCSVEIEEGVGSTVQFEGEISASKQYDSYLIKYEQNLNHLRVWVEVPNKMNAQINGFLKFEIPRNVSVTVKNISGNVSVSGVGYKELVLYTVSGSIKVEDIPCDADLATVSGSISGKFINGDLTAKTTSGTIITSNVLGNLVANSISGSIKAFDINGYANLSNVSGSINLNNILKDVTVSTVSGTLFIAETYSNVTGRNVSGKIEVKDVKGNLKLSNVSGKITLNNIIGEFDISSTSSSIQGSSVMITGNSQFKTGAGSIDIELLNASNSLSYELRSTSGSLEAEKIKSEKRLSIKDGPLTISGSTVSGSQKYHR